MHGHLQWSAGRIAAIVVMHLGALAAIPFFSLPGLIVAVSLYLVIGCLGICVGYHRYFTHQSFKTYGPVRWLLGIAGCLSWQGTPLDWVATHRLHHQHSDKPDDPHSPRHGWLWAHMLWFLPLMRTEKVRDLYRTYAPDLLKQRDIRFISKTYWLWHVLMTMAMLGGGYALGGWWMALSFLLWGVFVRTTLMCHATWAVNSLSHIWGPRPFQTGDDSRNNWFVALLAFGEGWHNNHHHDPTSARHGFRWWQIDLSYLTICLLEWCHLAWDVHHVPRRR